jgi:HK97 family phage major capsid protein
MDNDEVKAVVAAALAERDAAEQAKAQRVADLKTAAQAGYKKALEDAKSKGILKVAPAVVKTGEIGDDNDGMQAFNSYMKTGEINSGLVYLDGKSWSKQTVGSSDVKAAYNVTTGGQGGFLVPDPLYQQIIAKRQLRSWVRQAPVQFFSTPADHILVPVENVLAANFAVTAEAGNYTEDEPTVQQRDIILYKFTKNVRMSEEFVNYNTTNFDAWLTDALARAEAVTENQIFALGTGTGQPQGVLPNGAALAGTTTSTVAWASLTATAAADLSYIIGLLPAGYNVAAECIFLMSNTNKWLAKAAAAVFFAFVPTPTPQDFWGYPAYVVDGLPAIGNASGVGSHIFLNATMYGVAEKPGLLIQRNPYLHMQTGQIDIYANMYRGGAVLQPEAVVYSLNHA